jgi:tetratricopeptide (TPR) repeat protein
MEIFSGNSRGDGMSLRRKEWKLVMTNKNLFDVLPSKRLSGIQIRYWNHKMDRITKLKEYLQASPHDSFLQHALALEYIKIGDDDGARRLFEMILERDPAYVGSYYHLAKLVEKLGDKLEAVRVYKKGMEEAKKSGDNHAYGELNGAYEELIF